MTPTHKAVIMARGLGSRMRRADAAASLDAAQARAADAGMKAMIPIDRPFLDYVISALADAGITDVCLIIGPEHQAIRDHYAQGLTRVRVHFAVQTEPRGTADAIAAAEAFAGSDTFLALNADNYYPVEAYRQLAAVGGAGLVGFDAAALVRDSNIPAERVRAFALVTVGENDAGSRPSPGHVPSGRPGLDPGPSAVGLPHLVEIIEKPDEATYQRLAPHALVSMNLWSFTPAIFAACRRVQPSVRDELELQDAVRIARADLGVPFRVVPFAGGVLDLSHRG
ncbi:MAG: NTP transferase domain-containing protein, partial [Gemmatimonadetes bacterium]|nr:NTP transferase domain-containing protein [Gemmatimonadota bacterium]